MYLQNWQEQVRKTTNNRLFKHIKTSHCFEPYLNITNRAVRTSISKIRLSSHLFLVERGRWGNQKLDYIDRRCDCCGVVETEFHCLIECPRFNNERMGLIPQWLCVTPNAMKFERFIQCLNASESWKFGVLCMKVMKEYRRLNVLE